MTKRHFIALADAIRQHNSVCTPKERFTPSQLVTLADYCRAQNLEFKRDRWLGYITGENGPSGGARAK